MLQNSSIVSGSIDGGQVGGLINLFNNLVADIHTDLDTLAKEIIYQINDYHAQGVGSAGSFTQKTGWGLADADLGDLDPAVVDGTLYMRVTNISTNEVERVAIAIDGDDTMRVEQPCHASRLTKAAAVAVQNAANLLHGAVAIVAQGFNQ